MNVNMTREWAKTHKKDFQFLTKHLIFEYEFVDKDNVKLITIVGTNEKYVVVPLRHVLGFTWIVE